MIGESLVRKHWLRHTVSIRLIDDLLTWLCRLLQDQLLRPAHQRAGAFNIEFLDHACVLCPCIGIAVAHILPPEVAKISLYNVPLHSQIIFVMHTFAASL